LKYTIKQISKDNIYIYINIDIIIIIITTYNKQNKLEFQPIFQIKKINIIIIYNNDGYND